MSTCFDNTPHENLEHCPNDEINAGIATELFYVPCAFIATMAKPTVGSTYASRVTIPADGITLKSGKKWKKIDIQTEEGELKSTLVGNTGNKKSKTELDFLIPGMRTEVLGFVDAYKNTPCVFAVKDANSKLFVLGNKDLGARLESAEGTTGKKIEDNSGVQAKITANTKLCEYLGEITLE
ncbi:hypothetical protein AB4865_07295 [Capnocytophaga sp. ARDL2]|uniref:hypothetical protein n=1 Tax=Capnocytophaga sp. ARDL2 TaxID=3238809 RepID=UPI0035560C60